MEGVLLLPAHAFLMARLVMRTSATHLNIIQGSTILSAISEGDPASSTRLNTTERAPVTLVDEPTLESLPAYQTSVHLLRFYLPFVEVAGTFGNVVVVLIQRRLSLNQKSSMSLYLTALAILDTITLLTGWYTIVEAFGITVTAEYHEQRDFSDYAMDALCRIIVWITYACAQMSSWILVSLTVHRAVGVVWPNKTRNLLSRNNAKKVLVFIVSFCALSDAHLLYGHMLVPADYGKRAECFFSFVSERYAEFFHRVFLWLDLGTASFLPFACLLATNTVLVRAVGQSLTEARRTLTEGRSDQFASRDRNLQSMTLTLIATSVAFLLLTTPISVGTFFEQMQADGTLRDVRSRAYSKLAYVAGMVLWYTNFGINFYLYCLTGARYRAEFLKLFGCGGARTDQILLYAEKRSRQIKSSPTDIVTNSSLSSPKDNDALRPVIQACKPYYQNEKI